ncbi:hypothetical protein R6Q59_032472 [Mikania micrantha]
MEKFFRFAVRTDISQGYVQTIWSSMLCIYPMLRSAYQVIFVGYLDKRHDHMKLKVSISSQFCWLPGQVTIKHQKCALETLSKFVQVCLEYIETINKTLEEADKHIQPTVNG